MVMSLFIFTSTHSEALIGLEHFNKLTGLSLIPVIAEYLFCKCSYEWFLNKLVLLDKIRPTNNKQCKMVVNGRRVPIVAQSPV